MEDERKDEDKRRLNVNGVLRILGVSRNGYNSFKKRLPSDRQQRKEALMEKIMKIYDESHQNYGAPKTTEKLHSEGKKLVKKQLEIICVN